MLHPKRLAFALIALALVAMPLQARASDRGTSGQLVAHFLVRNPHGRVLTGYRPAEPVTGLWRPLAREEANPHSGDQNVRDLYSETVPLMELDW